MATGWLPVSLRLQGSLWVAVSRPFSFKVFARPTPPAPRGDLPPHSRPTRATHTLTAITIAGWSTGRSGPGWGGSGGEKSRYVLLGVCSPVRPRGQRDYDASASQTFQGEGKSEPELAQRVSTAKFGRRHSRGKPRAGRDCWTRRKVPWSNRAGEPGAG